ncbi:hypothetical protein CHS0354_003903, partial [Potamilus streckersoni]
TNEGANITTFRNILDDVKQNQVINLPHGHQLTDLVDRGFQRYDTNHDGLLELSELIAISMKEDINGDGNITKLEFETALNNVGNTGVADTIFDHYDTDKDGILQTNHIQRLYHLMDNNGKNHDKF